LAGHNQTKTERDAAIEFVRGHRLSIANAFERRLVRGDVVAVLARLYAGQRAGHDKIEPAPPLSQP
jgi:hypothetical protein